MADNVTTQDAALASVPSGTKIATDEDAAEGHVQRVKLSIATDGSATAIPADATNGLLVNLGANNDVTFAKGNKTSSTAAPTSSSGLILAANASRHSATIRNAGAVTVYVGPSGVATSDGIPLEPGETLTDISSVDAWHGVTSSGTGDLRIIEVA